MLEDSALQRKMSTRVLRKAFPKMDGSNLAVKGATMEEIRSFPAFVMAHDPPFKAIIVDQHLGVDEESHMVKGTVVVCTLRQLGCKATVFIHSASGNQKDVAEYLDAGADAYLSKDSSPICARRTINKANHTKVNVRSPLQPS